MTVLIAFVVPATSFILLVAVGQDLTAADFGRVRQQRALVLMGLFAPLVLLPPLALGLVEIFAAPPDVRAGVLLIAACPVGGVSSAFSYMARASPALSVTLTGISCLFASATIPMLGWLLSRAFPDTATFTAPLGALASQIFLVLGLPIAVGMLLRRVAPAAVRRAAPAMQVTAFAGILMVFALIIARDPQAFVDQLPTTVPLALTFIGLSMAVGWICAALLTDDRRDRFTIAAEFATRNIAVATTIAVTILGRFEFARFSAVYSLTEIPLMLAAIAAFRATTPPPPSA
jgi:BASS family bile acid:Na+ symporter